ncbi:hypothetical protein HRR83_004519 [Exophiala dermatitidis]|nr:hypothetical protein HRR74_004200 [Exophiala dermatitidis]KAJ4529272.1 hypothetical protein HRR73_000295 [Exophiala dermatitidis]KAJ4544075.1 hypothetical protein HRR76_002146 [Exophiala dermatitidis]KAJ4549250.1 hypothetical protein HRR77_004123 [Exophiala dermatitidis]KAJ4575540.1 hypothetical protein HRR79_002456 [Exophiala dermatitidis]
MLESTDAALVGTSLVLAVGTIVFVSIQLDRQYTTVGRLNASKWFLVISAFLALVMTGIVCAAAANGLGADITPLEFATRPLLQKLLVAVFPPYFLCNMFVKHAWLTFYYGLARSRCQRYFIHFMQFVAAGFGISSVFVILLQCIPLSHMWNPLASPDAKCVDIMTFFYCNSIIMIVNDVILYLIPMVLLRNVDMVKPHRLGLYALFALGLLVVVASILRLVALVHLDRGGSVSENYALVYLWAAVENHIGIWAACGGAIKQKTLSALHKIRRSYSGARYHSDDKSSSPTQVSTTLARSQCTEDRALYERTDSMQEHASSFGSKSPQTLYEMQSVPDSPTKSISIEHEKRLDV